MIAAEDLVAVDAMEIVKDALAVVIQPAQAYVLHDVIKLAQLNAE